MGIGTVRRRAERNRRYEVAWYDAQGRRRRELLPPTFTKADAQRVLAKRIDDAGRTSFGLPRKTSPTLREFVEGTWRKEVAIGLKPSTLANYEYQLRIHLLPYFGDIPLRAITRGTVKTFIATKARQQKWDHTSGKNPNPNRGHLSRKTVQNMVAVLSSIVEVATSDYELLPVNPLRGILKRRHYPTDAFHPRDTRPQVLEPEDFKRALAELSARPLRVMLFLAFTGLRWGECAALRIEEDVDLRRNKLRITRSLYKRVPTTPKEARSERDVDLSPIPRRILQATPWESGYVFSLDAETPLNTGTWLRKQWRQAQVRAEVRKPIPIHGLRHQFVSLLIAAGKHPKYIASQVGHASAGFTLDRYGHLFESIKPMSVEWPEDLFWPSGLPEWIEDACKWRPQRIPAIDRLKNHRNMQQAERGDVTNLTGILR